jgi:D-serine deaminase-like pyridoxal phosphate-dependent protein
MRGMMQRLIVMLLGLVHGYLYLDKWDPARRGVGQRVCLHPPHSLLTAPTLEQVAIIFAQVLMA